MKKYYLRIKERAKRIGLVHLGWVYFKQIKRGYNVYKRILNKYGHNTHIYIEHYPGTGDIYITCALLNSFRKSCKEDCPYVLTIIGKGSMRIAKLLDVDSCEILTQEESDLLISFYRFCGSIISNITILHYAPIAMHTRILDSLAGFSGLDFMTMYLTTVFPGLSWKDAVSFAHPEDISVVEEYFDENGLVQGNTVILFPFANTIEHLPWEHWEELGRQLREAGFSVCTNVEKGGPVIPGTQGIFVPYNHLREFVEMAGYAVGLRSGVFDMIADTSSLKFVLYPTPNFYKFGVGTIFDYFSLTKMGLCNNAFEYEFERIYAQEAFLTMYYDICQSSGRKPLLSFEQAKELRISYAKRHIHKVIPS